MAEVDLRNASAPSDASDGIVSDASDGIISDASDTSDAIDSNTSDAIDASDTSDAIDASDTSDTFEDAKHRFAFSPATEELVRLEDVHKYLDPLEQQEITQRVDLIFKPGSHWRTVACDAFYGAFSTLVGFSLVQILLILTATGLRARVQRSGKLKLWVEFCAGGAALTRACIRREIPSSCFDKVFSDQHNVVTDSGMLLWTLAIVFTAAVWGLHVSTLPQPSGYGGNTV